MAIARLYNIKKTDLMPQVMAFVECVKSLADVESVILFGSLARDEMTAASDIDLAVIVDQPDRVKVIKETIRQCKRSSLSWPADVFVCDRDWFETRKNFGGICVAIASQGQILFERPRGGLDSGA